jgi:poly(A) polymerase
LEGQEKVTTRTYEREYCAQPETMLHHMIGYTLAGQRLPDDMAETMCLSSVQSAILRTIRQDPDEFVNLFLTGMTLPYEYRKTFLWQTFSSKLLHLLFPEVVALLGVHQFPYHRLDAFGHTMVVVDQVPATKVCVLSALLHDSGKRSTWMVDEEGNNHFHGHEDVGAEIARAALKRLHVEPSLIEEVVTLVRLHMRPHQYSSAWSNSAVFRLQSAAGELWKPLLALCKSDEQSDLTPEYAHNGRIDALAWRAEHVLSLPMRIVPMSPLSGWELCDLFGLVPGPVIGLLKQHLHQAVIQGMLDEEDKEAARVLVTQYLETMQEDF